MTRLTGGTRRPLSKTLAIIKPDAIHKATEIIQLIIREKFQIVQRKRIHLTQVEAREFYREHAQKEFFNELTEFMASGPIEVLLLALPCDSGRQGENQDEDDEIAIKKWRAMLGPSDSHEARKNNQYSIRALFGRDKQRNACHGSDSASSAAREIKFFFPDQDLDVLDEITQPLAVDYLKRNVYPLLESGLQHLCEAKPENPVEWLGQWLLKHNPRNPRVSLPPRAGCS